VGSSLNQRTAEFSLCNTRVLLLDLAFKQLDRGSIAPVVLLEGFRIDLWPLEEASAMVPIPTAVPSVLR